MEEEPKITQEHTQRKKVDVEEKRAQDRPLGDATMEDGGCHFCALSQLQKNYAFPTSECDKKPKKFSKLCSCDPLQKFHSFLTTSFYKLGKCIAWQPSYFIILPVFLTILGLTGVQRVIYEEDPEKLFYPSGSPAPHERAVIEKHFPLNSSTFLPYHLTRIDGFARVLIEADDGETILRKYLWDEIIVLDEIVKRVTIIHKGKELNYNALCARWNGECFTNTVLELYDDLADIENGTMVINYPIMLFPLILPTYFGGIQVDREESYIESAEAINLNYFLIQDTEEDRERALEWENEFLKVMKNTAFDHLRLSYFAARSMKDLARENPEAIKPFIPVTVILMLAFSMVSAMMSDWVRSKIYLGFIGVLSAAMGTGTAFGFLMYFGVPMNGINNIIPFLMIGIGVDDMFVFLAAWRRTYMQDSTMKRLGKTYAEAGVSVTITSLTNMISFSIGAFTPIFAVRIFCIYTAFSILLTYVWHLTFFGGCLAIAGEFEKKQKHAILCIRVKPASQTNNKCYSFWCSGGINNNDPWNPKDNKEHVIMVFFRDYLGKMLTKNYVKGIIVVLFLVYLAGAIYGCTTVKEGLDRRKLVRDDSYIVDYYNAEDRLFRKYPYAIQVVLTGNITYSDEKTQKQILNLHDRFEELPFIANKILSQSWIRSWFRYLKRRPKLQKDITNEADFIRELRKNYLSGKDNPNAFDVEFNENFTRITACRFIIQTYEVNDTNADKNMMLTLRMIAEDSPFNVTVFNPNFILFDQYVTVRSAVMQSTFLAAIAMIAISLIFIPNPWCSLHVGFAILSIEVGVIGYMALWDVSLDPISMVTLIMCIGFSVDFSAHVSYSYLTAKSECPNDKIRECLFCLGLPIVQGGMSTLISIVTFILVPSYAYIAFFKVVLLVVFFAGMHGLFLIPVLLSIAGPESLKNLREKKSNNNSPLSVTPSFSVKEFDEDKSSSGPSPSTGISTLNIRNKNLDISSSFDDLPSKIRRIDPEGCSNNAFKIDDEQRSESSNSSEVQATEDVKEICDE